MKETDDQAQYPENTEGLLQTLARWDDKCVDPAFEAIRQIYGNLKSAPLQKQKANKRKNRKADP
jgi:hypothetical protein